MQGWPPVHPSTWDGGRLVTVVTEDMPPHPLTNVPRGVQDQQLGPGERGWPTHVRAMNAAPSPSPQGVLPALGSTVLFAPSSMNTNRPPPKSSR